LGTARILVAVAIIVVIGLAGVAAPYPDLNPLEYFDAFNSTIDRLKPATRYAKLSKTLGASMALAF